MGVKWVLRWKRLSVTEDDGGRTSDEDLLAAVVEQLACKAPRDTKTAKMEVKCYMLKQQPASATTTPAPGTTPQGMRDLWLVQSNDATDTCYLVDRQQNAVIEADNGMLTLVEKKLEYRIKTCVTFTGKRYTKGDFGLRIASATLTNLGSSGNVNLLGHVAELEYLPLSDPATAAGMLGAFLELMRAQIPRSTAGKPLGMFERPRDHTERYQHLPSTFSHQHTAVLYVDLSLTLCVHKSQQQQQLQQLRLQQQQIQQQQQQQQQQPVGMAR